MYSKKVLSTSIEFERCFSTSSIVTKLRSSLSDETIVVLSLLRSNFNNTEQQLHLYSFQHKTSCTKFCILELSWIKLVKNSWKKSGMAVTFAKYKLESFNWYNFVRIWVFQMISYSKLWNFEIFDNFFFRICHFPYIYSLPKIYSFLCRYEESFYASPRCVRFLLSSYEIWESIGFTLGK
jgi:hypothetical protein